MRAEIKNYAQVIPAENWEGLTFFAAVTDVRVHDAATFNACHLQALS
jgi:hypothetical protein